MHIGSWLLIILMIAIFALSAQAVADKPEMSSVYSNYLNRSSTQ